MASESVPGNRASTWSIVTRRLNPFLASLSRSYKKSKAAKFFLLGVDDFFLHLQQECEIKFMATTDKNADYDFIFGLAGILLIRGGH